MRPFPASLHGDLRGAALMEFALALPVMLLLILGGLEMGHTFYVKSILIGKLHKAARDMSLEGAGNAARVAAIQAEVTDAVHQVIAGAAVDYDIRSFHDYRNVAHRPEEFGDTDGDGLCNNGETFVDSNGNGVWDADGSRSGRGGAKDVLMMTASVSYPRLGLGRFFGAGAEVKLTATTLLRNQPSTTQAQPDTQTCP